jgi:hypothetical protein
MTLALLHGRQSQAMGLAAERDHHLIQFAEQPG